MTAGSFGEIMKEEANKLAGKKLRKKHLYCQQKIKKLNNWKALLTPT